jgi:preprotein translocase subunit SecD
MSEQRPSFSVIEGSADAPVRIALSLVHPRERIDIPVRDVLSIKSRAEQTFFCPELQASRTHSAAHARLQFKPDVRARIWRLTSQIVGEAMQIVVADEVICRPVVREPLGLQEGFNISAYDMEEARTLAAKLQQGWVIPNLRVV